jgi:hypothetical protein
MLYQLNPWITPLQSCISTRMNNHISINHTIAKLDINKNEQPHFHQDIWVCPTMYVPVMYIVGIKFKSSPRWNTWLKLSGVTRGEGRGAHHIYGSGGRSRQWWPTAVEIRAVAADDSGCRWRWRSGHLGMASRRMSRWGRRGSLDNATSRMGSPGRCGEQSSIGRATSQVRQSGSLGG